MTEQQGGTAAGRRSSAEEGQAAREGAADSRDAVDEDSGPSLKSAVPPKKGWVGQLDQSTFSLDEAVGGWRGAMESLAPGLVFIVAYVVTHELAWPLGLSAGLALLFTIARLLQRQPLTQAFAGAIGVAIGVVWAAASGKAENYFAWGLVTNGFFFLVFLVSLIVRKPAVGLIVDWVRNLEGKEQETTPLAKKRTMWATWVWVAVFGIRLSLQMPLYLAGNVVALGVVKLIGGLPLFALGGWFTWVLLRGMFADPQPSK